MVRSSCYIITQVILDGDDQEHELLLQPETRPTSHEQLVAEVKGTCTGLTVVEGNCAGVDDELGYERKAPQQTILRKNSKHDSPRTVSEQMYKANQRVLKKIPKVKRGLSSFVNGARLSVLADTGAAHNVISADYVKGRKFPIHNTSSSWFKLGSSSLVESIGTVEIDYAFAEEPLKVFKLMCHLLQDCSYDLVLGNAFLIATETMSKYRRRLTECIFTVTNIFHLTCLGNGNQHLKGTLAGCYPALAVPDTGAECNVIDLR